MSDYDITLMSEWMSQPDNQDESTLSEKEFLYKYIEFYICNDYSFVDSVEKFLSEFHNEYYKVVFHRNEYYEIDRKDKENAN